MLHRLLSTSMHLRANFHLAKSCLKNGVFVHRTLATAKPTRTLNLDSNNVVSSPFRKVEGFEKMLLHEHIWADLDKWPDNVALVCAITGRSYTYSQLRKLSGRLAMSFRKLKFRPRDSIAVVLPNIPEFAIVVLAASEAGLRTTLVNPSYTPVEIARQIKDSDASAVFTTPLIYPVVKKSVENNTQLKLPIIVINDGTGPIATDAIRFDDLINDNIEQFSTREKTDIDSEDDVYLPYSSGTTGLPKGVQLSHRNIVANLHQVAYEEVYHDVCFNGEQNIVPAILPMFHIYGLVVVLLTYLRVGAKLVCLPQFSVPEYIKMLENYKATILYLVPPIVQMMALNPQITPRHLENVKLIMSGAASLGQESISMFKERIGSNIRLNQGYGLTETSPAICMSNDAISESVGYVIPNTQIRIVQNEGNNRGQNLGVNQIGEIYVRGPQVMKGYFKNPKATAEAMDGDWFTTGDLGCFNEEGLVFIKGRLKELIKVKGYQVAPAELEELIRAYNKIEDVAVVGVPHEKFGEIPKAFIVPKKGMNIDPDEVKRHVAEQVAEYKQLGYVQVIDKIPRSASGKILRRELQNL